MKKEFGQIKMLYSNISGSKKLLIEKTNSIRERISNVSEDIKQSEYINIKDVEISKFYMYEMMKTRHQ